MKVFSSVANREYLTPYKEYEVIGAIKNGCLLRIMDDDGDIISVIIENDDGLTCPHLEPKNAAWVVVEK